MSATKQVLASLLLTEEALLTWSFRRWVSLFKFLNEFKAARETTAQKNESFPFRITSVNVTKSAVSCGFGQTY